MCSLFFTPNKDSNTNNLNMDQNFQGDLTDILRASSGSTNTSSSFSDLLGLPNNNNETWQFPSTDHPIPMMTNFPSTPLLMDDQSQTQTLITRDSFGDPFSNMRDPLFLSNTTNTTTTTSPSATTSFVGESGFYNQAAMEDAKFRPAVFSRMLQISPKASPEASSSPRAAMRSSDANGGCDSAALQISSPRNNPGGIKRRKSQAKKVVCIPAPAASNSRASGEVVPSDLWAWRKYGQKPIKGSPYPRGYYRCSSSKGCSARKQVERSRTDPNMLVITYTSEHNHPWPTQRNALAGSTRSQPSKSNNNATSKNSPISPQPHHKASTKEEKKSEIVLSNNSNKTTTSTASASVKEENVDQDTNNNNNNSVEKRLESLDDSAFSSTPEVEFGFRAGMSNVNDQDFFADLGEIEADPLNLLFNQAGFSTDHHQDHHKDMVTGNNNNNNNNKGLDPFSMFDWSEGNTNNKQRE